MSSANQESKPKRGRVVQSAACIFLALLICLPIRLAAEDGSGLRDQQKWDTRYAGPQFTYGTEPVNFLAEQIHKLPRGKALCLAAGEGRNAVFLAQKGFEVLAVDISPEGLKKARKLASERGVRIRTAVADLRVYDMGRSQWDLITDFYYHEPVLYPRVMAALKPGGMFILQNFSVDQPRTNRFGPKNPDLLVKPNELLSLFKGYRVRYYEDTVVDLDEGMHQGPGAVIRLMVQKAAVF